MRTLTVRLPLSVIADLEAESRRRKISKSDVVRDRLQRRGKAASDAGPDPLEGLRDLIGSVKGLPHDLSERKKHYPRIPLPLLLQGRVAPSRRERNDGPINSGFAVSPMS